MNTYPNICVNHNTKSFYIAESFKPKTCTAVLRMMTHIELIVKNKFSYDPNRHDVYSNQTQFDLFENLRKISFEIYNEFNLKKMRERGCYKRFKKKKQQLWKIYKIIDKYIQVIGKYIPSPIFSLPAELIQKIFDYLPASDFGAVAQLCHQGEAHAITAIMTRAKEFGYKGQSHTWALKYINNLFKSTLELNRQKLIPERHVFYEQHMLLQKKVDVEKTLQKLKNFSTEDLFLIFSNENVHDPSFQEFREIFALQGKRKVTKIDNDEMIKKGEKALFFAVKNSNKNTVKLLLPHNVNLNAEFLDNFTPLTINTDDSDITEMLIKQGAFMEHQTNPEGDTALHLAAKKGQLETVKVLLKNGANRNAINFLGRTPLFWASNELQKNVVEELLKNGADPNIASFNGFPPLTANTSDPDITRMLIMHGALINHQTQQGNTALHFAVEKGQLETVKVLLDAGANPKAINLKNQTPLDLASFIDNKDKRQKVVEELLKYQKN